MINPDNLIFLMAGPFQGARYVVTSVCPAGVEVNTGEPEPAEGGMQPELGFGTAVPAGGLAVTVPTLAASQPPVKTEPLPVGHWRDAKLVGLVYGIGTGHTPFTDYERLIGVFDRTNDAHLAQMAILAAALV
ncbi:MAG: hypothetical protein RL094_249 [Candidatus Parcubacteria bacterium]|jgi:hypothetical protein